MRLTKVSDSLYRVSEGRDTIGWTRHWASGWKCEAMGVTGEGNDAIAAFKNCARKIRDIRAKREGFRDFRDQVEQHNDQVRRDVAFWNSLIDDFEQTTGMRADFARRRIRRRRIRL